MVKCFLIVFVIILTGCNQKANQRVDTEKLSVWSKAISEIKPESLNETYEFLLNRAKLENKKLFLVFSFQGCSPCKIFEKYHNDSVVIRILGNHFIIKKIDIDRTPGGKELYNTYGKVGFPSWTIIDSTKKVIIDSGSLKNGNGNVGFPRTKTDIEYYINAITKAAPSINHTECDILVRKLNEYGPKKNE
jgi:thioredoxin-related protein